MADDVRDSIFTNPDSLRILYRNPRNPLNSLDQATSTGAGEGTGEPPIQTFDPNQDLPNGPGNQHPEDPQSPLDIIQV